MLQHKARLRRLGLVGREHTLTQIIEHGHTSGLTFSFFTRPAADESDAVFAPSPIFPAPLGMDLLMLRQHVLRRDLADCTVQADVVVTFDVASTGHRASPSESGVPGRMRSPLSDLSARCKPAPKEFAAAFHSRSTIDCRVVPAMLIKTSIVGANRGRRRSRPHMYPIQNPIAYALMSPPQLVRQMVPVSSPPGFAAASSTNLISMLPDENLKRFGTRAHIQIQPVRRQMVC